MLRLIMASFMFLFFALFLKLETVYVLTCIYLLVMFIVFNLKYNYYLKRKKLLPLDLIEHDEYYDLHVDKKYNTPYPLITILYHAIERHKYYVNLYLVDPFDTIYIEDYIPSEEGEEQDGEYEYRKQIVDGEEKEVKIKVMKWDENNLF